MGRNRMDIEGFVGKREENTPLGRHRCKWKDNITMDLEEIEWGCITGLMCLNIVTRGKFLYAPY
jgi:hypothetical protein